METMKNNNVEFLEYLLAESSSRPVDIEIGDYVIKPNKNKTWTVYKYSFPEGQPSPYDYNYDPGDYPVEIERVIKNIKSDKLLDIIKKLKHKTSVAFA